MKRLFLAVIISAAMGGTLFAYEGAFILTDNDGKVSINPKTVQGSTIKKLAFRVYFSPSSTKIYDTIVVLIKRPGVTVGSYSFDESIIEKMKKIEKYRDDEAYKNLRQRYFTIIDFTRRKNGAGFFYTSKFKRKISGNILLSPRGTNRESDKPAGSYTLTAWVIGMKIIRFKQDFVNSKEKITPIYGTEKFIVKPITITIITSTNIPPEIVINEKKEQ
jgi:hypothetical protein